MGGLACRSPWGHKESVTTERPNNNGRKSPSHVTNCDGYRQSPGFASGAPSDCQKQRNGNRMQVSCCLKCPWKASGGATVLYRKVD